MRLSHRSCTGLPGASAGAQPALFLLPLIHAPLVMLEPQTPSSLHLTGSPQEGECQLRSSPAIPAGSLLPGPPPPISPPPLRASWREEGHLPSCACEQVGDAGSRARCLAEGACKAPVSPHAPPEAQRPGAPARARTAPGSARGRPALWRGGDSGRATSSPHRPPRLGARRRRQRRGSAEPGRARARRPVCGAGVRREREPGSERAEGRACAPPGPEEPQGLEPQPRRTGERGRETGSRGGWRPGGSGAIAGPGGSAEPEPGARAEPGGNRSPGRARAAGAPG